jgi:hypothetical protein
MDAKWLVKAVHTSHILFIFIEFDLNLCQLGLGSNILCNVICYWRITVEGVM